MFTLQETLQLAKAQLTLGRQNESIHLTVDQINAVCYHLIDVDEAYTLLYRERPSVEDDIPELDILDQMPKTWTEAMEDAFTSDDANRHS